MEKEMTLVKKQDRLAVLELSREDIEFVSGGGDAGPPPPPPKECKTVDSTGNVIYTAPVGGTCGPENAVV
jgi:hypothetical protein